MSSAGEDPSRFAPSLAEAFDWRAGRTWSVFLGYAFTMGTAMAAIVLLVSALMLALPSGNTTIGMMLAGAALMFLLFMLVVLILIKLIKPRPQRRADNAPDMASWLATARVKYPLDLLLDLVWCCFAVLPIFAAGWGVFNLSVDKVSEAHSDALTLMLLLAMVLVLGVGVLFVPDLLHRWARPKAPRAPSPPGQADSGREPQP